MILWKRLLWQIWLLLLWLFKRKLFIFTIVFPTIAIFTILSCNCLTFFSSSPARRPKGVNLNQFKFVHNNETICATATEHRNKTPFFLITIIHSARHHFEYRQKIRETWGSVHNFKSWTLRKVFILGSHDHSDSHGQNEQIGQESRQHGDMIIADFIDSYRNLTLKHLIGYKWVLNYCANATFVLKTDDDMFINPFQLVNYLINTTTSTKLVNSSSNSNSTSTTSQGPDRILCHAWKDKPKRVFFDKWRISREEFSDDEYPLFCIGAAYLTTIKIMKRIFSIHDRVTFFWIDDIFVTGILRDKYNNRLLSSGSSQSSSSELEATEHQPTIEIQDIQDLFHLKENKIGWEPHKLFYLLKRLEGMNFQGLETYWSLTLVHEMSTYYNKTASNYDDHDKAIYISHATCTRPPSPSVLLYKCRNFSLESLTTIVILNFLLCLFYSLSNVHIWTI